MAETQANLPHSKKLSWGKKLGWGVGDVGLNVFFKAIALLLLPFYTEILGLDPILAGAVFLLASLFDGVGDCIVGAIVDRTRSRFGSYRPYLIFASPVLTLCFVAAFIPIQGSQTTLFIYALLSQTALRTAYGLVSIPYSALSSRISDDSNERSQLAGIRLAFAMLGGIIVTYLMPTLVASLQGQFTADSVAPYMISALIAGLVALPFFWICFTATTEPKQLENANPQGFYLGAIIEDMIAMFRIIQNNGALLRVVACMIVSSFAFKMTEKCLVYYVYYYLDSPDLVSKILPIVLFINMVFCPFWAWVAQRTSKRDAWLIANIVSAVGYAAFYFSTSRDPVLATALLGLISIGNSAYLVLIWAMIPDTVEYNEYKTGQRHDGKIFGVTIFSKRLALGLNGLLLGFFMAAIGFESGTQSQSPETIEGLKIIMTVVPLIGIVLSAALIWGYRLDQTFHKEIADKAAANRMQPPAGPPGQR